MEKSGVQMKTFTKSPFIYVKTSFPFFQLEMPIGDFPKPKSKNIGFP
jgi:hypothetical protein